MSLSVPPGLTVAQTAIWLDQQLFAGRPIYNTGQWLAIEGDLRPELFETALHETLAEFPGLRLPPGAHIPSKLAQADFRNAANPLAAAEAWMRGEMRTTIAMDDPPLYRFALLRISDDVTIWFQKYHHIIIDATGRRLLCARTAARYRALRFGDPLPALEAATPEDIRDAEARYEASSSRLADRKYWMQALAHLPAPLIDAHREHMERARSGVHERFSLKLPRHDFERLRARARELGSSEFRAIIALTYAAFARLYNRADIVLGLELANRSDPASRAYVGLLARPLPMPLNIGPAATVADILQHVEQVRKQSYPHRNYPVQELARDLDLTRKGRHGLFDVVVNYIPGAYDFAFEQKPVTLTNLSYGFAAPWMITIADANPAGDLDISIDTDGGLVERETAVRLAAALETLLRHGLDDAALSLSALPIMLETDRSRTLALAAGDTVALPQRETLASLCAAQAARTPDAIALRCEARQVSYSELHAHALRLARRLAALGIGPGMIVGIALPRTPDLVAAVLAVHKAGAAYLALDPSYPAERLRFMVEDSRVPAIITTAELASAFADSGATLILDREEANADDDVSLVSAGPNDLAYVLYTSGSTGRPKAVAITHANLVNLVHWGRSIVTDDELGGFLFSTSLNFDLSAFEIFVPLAFGGCAVLVENLLALQAAPQRNAVRLINSGPSLLDALLRVDAFPPDVTTVILAGEKLPRHLADALFAVSPQVRLLNCYGPTETTVYSSWAKVRRSDTSDPTIGRALWNTTLLVLDERMALVPPGAEGELYIGGAGVARGYVGRPDLTAERFKKNPFGDGNIYRTGDRVRWRADGELDFLGRADDQMKINGIRVEPGEIEAVLRAQPGVAAAVVALREESSGVRRLVAYVVASPAGRREADLRSACERSLPRNMVPAIFVWLKSLPMTPNGKIDRKALPAPPSAPAVCGAREANPKTALEGEIAGIFQEVLRRSSVDTHSDFFDLGGDSLALLSLFGYVEARYGRRLTVDILADGLTVAGLAQVLAADAERIDAGPVVTLQPLGDLPPFFCVHGIGGEVMHLQRLAAHMGRRRPVFGVRQPAGTPPTTSLVETAARYVAAMREIRPEGPYYLGGFSFGATVAYEMAVQLVDQGCEVGLLAVIDQRKPGWRLSYREAVPVLHRLLMQIPGRVVDDWRNAPASGRVASVRRSLLRWSRAAAGKRANAQAMFGIDPAEKQLIDMFDANLRALRAYRPRPLRAPMTLFRASRQSISHAALDGTLGWREYAMGGLRVRHIKGSHGTILREPTVRELAGMLVEELDATTPAR